jgi:glucose-1-phosphate thymidylyltransferase
MKLIVLAAGYATRLYPLTKDRPKQLLEVAGRPILDHVLEKLEPIGFDGVYVVTNAKFAPIFGEWVKARGDVTVIDDGTSDDSNKLGAIGDLDLVLREQAVDDDVIVVAGDNLFTDSLEDFGRFARARRAPMVALYDVGDLAQMSKYNAIEVDGEGRVTHFEEKPQSPTSTLMAIALYYYPREILPLVRRYVDEGNNPDQPGRLVEWLYSRTPVYTWRVPGSWLDIGSPETLREADELFRRTSGANA